MDLDPRPVAHDGPVYSRPIARPSDQDSLVADGPDRLPRPSVGELGDLLLRMVASPGLCSRAWVTDQYDRYVQGNTVLAQPEDAGVVRIDETTNLGVAVATDGNGRYSRLDPYAGAQLALAEAYRNVAATGAEPIAVTDCLNFGSPEDPGVMWQFSEAVRGLADGCLQLGTPVTGGNVSFYNQTGSTPILPTPVVGVLGVLDDVDPADADGVRRGRGRGRPARRDRRGLRRLGVGVRGARPPRRHRRRRSTWPPSGRWARCCGRGCCAAPTTCPTAGWRRRWSSPACAAASARGRGSTATRSSPCSASRPPGPWSPSARTTWTGCTALAEERGVPCRDARRGHRRPGAHRPGVLTVPLSELRTASESTLPGAVRLRWPAAAIRPGPARPCWPRPT